MSGTIKWEVIKEKSEKYKAEFRGSTGGRDYKGSPIWDYHAYCKWDGCIELTQYSNGYGYGHECLGVGACGCEQQDFHICSLAEFLFELGVLLEEARHYYRDKPGAEYWGENKDG